VRLGAAVAGALALALVGCGDGRAPAPVGTSERPARRIERPGRRLVVRYRIESRYAHRSLAQIAVSPPAAASPSARRRPLLVFLHGKGAGPESTVNGDFLAALGALGDRAPAVVFPDGADHSYFHDRRDGDWDAYVTREAIPAALRRLHADPQRVAIGGISMGGFGAFDIALHHPRGFCAVGGHSPAIWRTAVESAPGAFDGDADFARNDVIAMARVRRPAPRVWLDSGDRDPFVPGDRALAAALGTRVRTWSGGHEGAYWRSHYDDYLRFYASALARC
jgi:S-formylglutathione hydrolase FrmB